MRPATGAWKFIKAHLVTGHPKADGVWNITFTREIVIPSRLPGDMLLKDNFTFRVGCFRPAITSTDKVR